MLTKSRVKSQQARRFSRRESGSTGRPDARYSLRRVGSSVVCRPKAVYFLSGTGLRDHQAAGIPNSSEKKKAADASPRESQPDHLRASGTRQ